MTPTQPGRGISTTELVRTTLMILAAPIARYVAVYLAGILPGLAPDQDKLAWTLTGLLVAAGLGAYRGWKATAKHKVSVK